MLFLYFCKNVYHNLLFYNISLWLVKFSHHSVKAFHKAPFALAIFVKHWPLCSWRSNLTIMISGTLLMFLMWPMYLYFHLSSQVYDVMLIICLDLSCPHVLSAVCWSRSVGFQSHFLCAWFSWTRAEGQLMCINSFHAAQCHHGNTHWESTTGKGTAKSRDTNSCIQQAAG